MRVKISEICEQPQYGYTAKADHNSGNARMLRITDIQNGTVDWNTVPHCDCDDIQKYKLTKDDIVFARTGATVGKSYRISDCPENSIFASYLIRLRTLRGVNPKFLSYFFQSQDYWNQIQDTSSGTGQPNVNGTKLAQLDVPFFSTAQQTKISEKLDELLGKLNEGRKRLNRVPELLQKFNQSILDTACTGKLTADWRVANKFSPTNRKNLIDKLNRFSETQPGWKVYDLTKAKHNQDPESFPHLPDGWQWCQIADLALYRSGVAFESSKFVQSGIQVIRLGNLYEGTLDLSRDPVFLKTTDPELHFGLVLAGDILVSQTGTRHKRDYGNFVLIERMETDRIAVNQRIMCLRSADPVIAEWLNFTSKYRICRDFLFSTETGGVNQGNVGIEGVMGGYIPMPPAEELPIVLQRVKELESQADNCFKMTNTLLESKLNSIEKSLLKTAFDGQLIPPSPNDEPVSVLLERISIEKIGDGISKLKKESSKKSKTQKISAPISQKSKRAKNGKTESRKNT